MLRAISEAQSRFITAATSQRTFAALLQSLLELTGAEYGFIDELHHKEDGTPFLTARAITNIAWSDETRAVYPKFLSGELTFDNLNALYSPAMRGEVVIANDAPRDPRRSGVPPGHPALTRFLGVPMYAGETLVGVLGLANTPEDFDDGTVAYLEPMVRTAANLIAAWRTQERLTDAHDDLGRRLRARIAELEELRERALDLARERAAKEARVTLALEASKTGTWAWDTQTDVVDWDERMHEIFGTSAETFGGNFESFAATLHPDDVPATGRAVEASLASGETFKTVYRVVWPDGTVRSVEARGLPVTHEGAQLMCGVCLDVTDRLATAQRLADAAAELARSNADLAQFAYVASHDLKAPLRAIANLSEWLEEDLEGTLDAGNAKKLHLLRARVGRMERLLDDLLQYSRAGREAHTPESVDLAALLEDVVRLLALPPGFSVEGVGALPSLRAERAPLEQVLRNLIDNAVKHHDRAEGTVRVSAQRGERWVEFAVTDDGPGIPAEYRERVFALFQTLRPRDEVEGSGMGLALIRRLVERGGGKVWIDPSGAGRGTTIRFTWPAEPKE